MKLQSVHSQHSVTMSVHIHIPHKTKSPCLEVTLFFLNCFFYDTSYPDTCFVICTLLSMNAGLFEFSLRAHTGTCFCCYQRRIVSALADVSVCVINHFAPASQRLSRPRLGRTDSRVHYVRQRKLAQQRGKQQSWLSSASQGRQEPVEPHMW